MDPTLIAALIGVGVGIASGVFGYWFVTFQMQPVLNYKEIRSKILIDIIYYLHIYNTEKERYELPQDEEKERQMAFRRLSGRLKAAIELLPKWYADHLARKHFDPSNAVNELIAYSDTRDIEELIPLGKTIRGNLGLPKFK